MLVGNTGNTDLGDSLAVHDCVGAGGVLRLLGQNLHATGVDRAVGAAQHLQCVPVQGADVAGAVDPELGEAVLVLVAVAAGDHRAFQDDASGAVGVRVLDAHGRTRQRLAVVDHPAAGLAGTIGQDVVHARLVQLLAGLISQRRTADEDGTEELQRLDAFLGLQQGVHLWRNQRGVQILVREALLQRGGIGRETGHAKARALDQRGGGHRGETGHHATQNHLQARNVVGRQRQQPRARLHLQLLAQHLLGGAGGGAQVRGGEQRALRGARGPGGGGHEGAGLDGLACPHNLLQLVAGTSVRRVGSGDRQDRAAPVQHLGEHAARGLEICRGDLEGLERCHAGAVVDLRGVNELRVSVPAVAEAA